MGSLSRCVSLVLPAITDSPHADSGVGLPDPVFMNAFLLTYRSFTTPLELLQMLKLRYDVPLPTRATSAELEQYIKVHQTPIRLRYWCSLSLALLCSCLGLIDDPIEFST